MAGESRDRWPPQLYVITHDEPTLEAAGVLTSLDQTALAMYCEAFARWRHATDHVAQHGPVIVSPSSLARRSPYLVIADCASEQMVRMQGIEVVLSTQTRRSRFPVAVIQVDQSGP